MTTRKAKPAVPTSLEDPAVKAVRETLHLSWELIGMDAETCSAQEREWELALRAQPGDAEALTAFKYWADQRRNAQAYRARCRGLLAGISQLRPDGSFPLVGWQRAAKEAKRING
jgi:hypothetical protein